LPLGNRVLGYYCLSTASALHADLTGKLRRNMPEPVPVLVVGRLAVDDAFRGKTLGKSLLKDAVIRCLQASKTVGVRAIMVHAKDARSVAFYAKYQFAPSPANPRTLFLPIDTVEQVFR
jgi:predicted GNAT family N-acyltransferase